MKKQNLSSFSKFPCGAVILVLSTLMFISCASKAWAADGKAFEAVVNDSTPGQKKTSTRAGTSHPETVKTRLTALFDLCKDDKTDSAAAYFVYRGPDKAREWKDTFNPSDPEEKREVEDICRRIKGYLETSQGYQFGAVKVEREPEGEWHVIEVSFKQENQTKKVYFAFLPLKGGFAIGDID